MSFIGFNAVLTIDGDGHVHEVNGGGKLAKFPGKTRECIHSILKLVPLNCVMFLIWILVPDDNDIVDESLVKDNVLVMSWDKFLFDTIIDGCIWGCRWSSHGSSIELFEGEVTKHENIFCHDKA